MKRLSPGQKLSTARALKQVAQTTKEAQADVGHLPASRLIKLANGLTALARYQQKSAKDQAAYAIKRAGKRTF